MFSLSWKIGPQTARSRRQASGDDVPILLDCEKLDADWDGLRADAKEVFVAQLRTKNEVEAGKAMLLEAAERVVKDQALLP